jgi:leucyl-tRNA synthetase
MSQKYEASEVESKWREKWASDGLYKADLSDSDSKYYNLVMFPYPSGDKLHIGHWFSYAPADSWGRYMRMNGKNVFEPIGFDSFGLPAENYAIKTGTPPAESTTKNVEYMREQLRAMGTMYDWDQEVVTSSPEYYKWTQWIFLKLYERGLAYRKKAPVNWCPSCKTVLANEQAQDGTCERCDSEVTKKDLTQWFFNIRKYAEKLLNHDELDWPERTKLMQKNWIGKSEGSNIVFKIDGFEEKVVVYTTRIDTLFGCTYMVLAPEHPLVSLITSDEQKENVEDYIKKARLVSDIDRSSEDREKTGVFTGSYAMNPVNGEKVPVWIADYVLVHYGSGAVMAVPGHDARDHSFAKKYDLDIVEVIKSTDGDSNVTDDAFCEDGVLVESSGFTGQKSAEARKGITELLAEKKLASFHTEYKLRDWLVSRQRYWGSPIPIIHCSTCGEVPVPESDLPVLLPEDVDFKPVDGQSPLSTSESFVSVACPKCGADSRREFDTMDTFVCSSWYFLRYPSTGNDDVAFDPSLTGNWLPVDMYIGGPEHACMHLLYARFITMALKDAGLIDFEEPFKRLVHQGMITKDGAKMSKSKGNVVGPDEFVSKYGSDVFRMYLMFTGPFEQGGDWNDKGINGVARFLDRMYTLLSNEFACEDEAALEKWTHKTVKRVTEDIEAFQFNTAIAALMEFLNFASKNGVNEDSARVICRAMAPLAPHFAEEIWREIFGNSASVFDEKWPEFDSALCADDMIEMVIQINGKVRGKIEVAADIEKDEALKMAREMDNVAKYLAEGEVVKEIFVPGKLVSFVVN